MKDEYSFENAQKNPYAEQLITAKDIDVTQEATPEQVEMLTKAAELFLPNDCEYPEFTEAELKAFKRISDLKKDKKTPL